MSNDKRCLRKSGIEEKGKFDYCADKEKKRLTNKKNYIYEAIGFYVSPAGLHQKNHLS